MSQPTEAELIRLSQDPKYMYERWRARIKVGEKQLDSIKNPEEKKKKTQMLKAQMEKAKEYKNKIK